MLGYWVYDLQPFVIEFPQGWWIPGIRWYGVAYLLGFIVAYWLLNFYVAKHKTAMTKSEIWMLLEASLLGVLVGGRLGYLILYDWHDFVHDPLIAFKIWNGGMASHGGIIGVILAVIWFSRRTHHSLWTIGDIGITVVPPGLFLGRVANFVNGELWGKVTTVPWAVIFPASAPPGTAIMAIAPRHPSQLYEGMLEGLVLFVYTQWRFWWGRGLKPGQLAGEFFIGYAAMRIIGEYFREPDAALIMGLSRGTFYSLFIAVGGLGLLAYSRYRSPQPGDCS